MENKIKKNCTNEALCLAGHEIYQLGSSRGILKVSFTKLRELYKNIIDKYSCKFIIR